MKRPRKARSAPDWRFQGFPMLRDVEPGKVAVPLYEVDGSLVAVCDFPVALVGRMEQGARKAGQAFAEFYTAVVSDAVARKKEAGA